MTTTWNARIAGTDGKDLRLYALIQGVPNVFQEAGADVPSTLETSTRTRSHVIEKITISPSKLNMRTRRMEGGTVVITFVDDNDGTLAALFTPRKRRSTYITANQTSSSATIDVTATTAFAGQSHAYIDAETFTYTGTTATTFTGCTRGAFSSQAQAHFGNSERGSGVYTSPPSWKGRRVYLKSYFLQADGTTTASLSRSEGVYEIEQAPEYKGNHRWELRCSDLSDGFWKKRIGSGLKEVELTDDSRMIYNLDNGEYTINVGNGDVEDQFAAATYSTHAIVKLKDDSFICRQVSGIDALNNTITLGAQELVSPLSVRGGAGAVVLGQTIKTIRHVAILQDYAPKIAKIVLLSRLGDAANGGFDQLPGRNRTFEGGPEWRMGAGLSSSDVDSSSFDTVSDGQPWSYVIDGEVTVGDFLFDFCLHTHSVAYVTRAGKLAVTSIAETANATSMTIDDSVVIGADDPVVTYDEDGIYPRVQLVCNYDPLTKEYCAEINMSDTELQARYPNTDDVLELSSKAIVLQGTGALGKHAIPEGIQAIARNARTRSQVETMMERLQFANGRGNGIVTLQCHLDVMTLEMGSLVALTLNIPDLEGATSTSAKLCRVLSVCPDWDNAEASLVLQMLDKLYVIAPACRITSAAGSDITLLASNDAFELPTTQPQFHFAAGQTIQVWDVSAATKVSRTIVSIAGATLTLSAAPGFVVEADVDFIKPDNASLATSNESATGFDGFDYTYMIRADENHASVPFVSRWR